MKETASITPAARAMRRKADQRRGQGWIRNSFWLSPEAVEIIDRTRDTMGLASREAAINAVFERIGDDMFLQQEFLAVTK